jgi:hypothetical protein
MAKGKKYKGATLREDIIAVVEEEARHQHRSFSAQVEIILEQWAEARKQIPKSK